METAALRRSILRAVTRQWFEARDMAATWMHTRSVEACGAGCSIAHGVEIRNAGGVEFGDSVVLKRGVIIDGRTELPDGGVRLGNYCYVREYSYLDSYGGLIDMPEYVAVGQYSLLDGEGGLRVGRYAMLGAHTYIIASNHRFDTLELPYKLQGDSAHGIEIGDNVWIGGGSILLDGVSIGRNSIVGAGSIVTRSVPPNTLHMDAAPREHRLRLNRGMAEWRDLQLASQFDRG